MSETVSAVELEEIGLIAIVRANQSVDLLSIANALADGGIRAMEITLNTPGALDAIKQIRSELGARLHVGAGTILEPDDARRSLDSGAEFIVTPTLQPETIALCNSANVPIFCGCLTPTEALSAHYAGADFIKIFPAETFGPAYIKAILAPLPFLKIVPTGGVTINNLKAWFDSGCAAVAVGSSLINSDVIQNRDWDGLRNTASHFVQTLNNIRSDQASNNT
jgi:2-dehydro-3-deoxyphosphogluconate aldolase/(4S)-4-hydroxy-2-oxoglutarate aldolase